MGTTKEVCKAIPKEICVLKLVTPHPAPNSYLPPQQQQGPPQYQPVPSPSYDQFNGVRRESGSGTSEDPFVITVDGEKFAELNELPPNLSQIISSNAPLRHEQFRQVREQPDDEIMLNRAAPNTFQRKPQSGHHKRHSKPLGMHHMNQYQAASESKVHIVKPQPGGNNAHRVTPVKSEQPPANAISDSPTPTKPADIGTSETTSVTALSTPEPVKQPAFAAPLTSYSPPPQAPPSYAPPPTYKTQQVARQPRARSSTQQTFTASSLRNHPGSIF